MRPSCWVAEFRLETARLVLRSWRAEDLAPFAAICADPVVMATLGPVMDLEQSRALIERARAREAEDGHTFWALERREDARLIGWCGVIRGSAGPVAGKAEIGWRLAADCWGQGYASEAARAVIALARTLGHRVLRAGHMIDNPASGRVLRKVGFRPTGEIRKRFSLARGREVDSVEHRLELADPSNCDGPTDRMFKHAA